ncbi:shikimate kinase 2, chloroplastic-like [Panicum virgatum]|uniref:shikimate kinase 2, chloroplastic-like n=1 Tax=Panicum virgatum TaxID=38727 RepID=UPI0019D64833|nr:shikimate kinase 2, chloroplastic-like [Panicum virgatum]
MGSGKSTVGKILAEVLGYSFFDSDNLVEQAVGMSSVAQIFKIHSEAFFRENESNVLRDLSSMRRLVVATGGGAVIRPINWNYMKKGLSVWLDVPLDALAKQIAAKQGHQDVSKLTPTDIAIEALLQIGNFVNEHPTMHGQVSDFLKSEKG